MIYEEFWWSKLRRLGDRYGRGRWCGMTWLQNRVTASTVYQEAHGGGGGDVLVGGKRITVDKERLSALREIHRLERKLR